MTNQLIIAWSLISKIIIIYYTDYFQFYLNYNNKYHIYKNNRQHLHHKRSILRYTKLAQSNIKTQKLDKHIILKTMSNSFISGQPSVQGEDGAQNSNE